MVPGDASRFASSACQSASWSRSSQEKAPWRNLPSLEGTVERQFLHPVLLGESILPYRLFRSFEGVIPVTPTGRLLDSAAAGDAGLERLAGWMEAAEAAWVECAI